MKKLLTLGVALIAFFIGNSQVPSYIPTNGLMAWYPFNGNANDESGNGNNGIVHGATLTTDKNGASNKAYSFNGTSNYIEVANAASLNPSAISMNVWIKPLSNDLCIIDKENPTNGTELSYRICHRDNWSGNSNGLTTAWGINQCNTVNASSVSGSPANAIPNNQWSMITVIIGANGICSQYYNGQLLFVDTGTSFHSCNSATSLLRFGTHWTGEPEWFNGTIDDIGLWNRALSTQEIKDLYNQCKINIASQPTNKSDLVGQTVSFVVSTTGTPQTFQWQSNLGMGYLNLTNAGQYSGVDNDTLTISNLTLSNNNQLLRCIINSGTCIDTTDVATLTVQPDAIIDINNVKPIEIFPNPTSSVVTIKANVETIGQSFSVIDLLGKELFLGTIKEELTSFNIDNLSNGLYFVIIGSDSQHHFKLFKK